MSMKNMAAVFGTMALLRRVDQEEPLVLLYARFAYLAYILVSAFIHTILHVRITKQRDQTPLQVPIVSKPKNFSEAMAADKHGMDHDSDSEPPKTETITVMEYDLRQLSNSRNGFIANVCLLAAIHYKMQSVSPLIMSAVTGIVRLMFDDPLIAIHFRGKPAVGRFTRPFKPPENKLAAMLKELAPKEPPTSPSEPHEDLHDDGETDDDDDKEPVGLNDMDDSDIKSDFVDEEKKKDK